MYSISTNFFPENTDAMVGYMEAVCGLGLCLGPIIGTALYSLYGYNFVFLFFGGIFIFFTLFVNCIFPKVVDGKPPNENLKDTKSIALSVGRHLFSTSVKGNPYNKSLHKSRKSMYSPDSYRKLLKNSLSGKGLSS